MSGSKTVVIATVWLCLALGGAKSVGLMFNTTSTGSGLIGASAPKRLPEKTALTSSAQRVVRHLRRQLRRHARMKSSVFAATKEEAVQKIIDDLRGLDGEHHMPFSVRPRALGFCEDTFEGSELEDVTRALQQLPQDYLRLHLGQDVGRDFELRERAHRVVQELLGDSRYRELHAACSRARADEQQVEEKQRLQMVSTILTLSDEQQVATEEILRKFDRIDPLKHAEQQAQACNLLDAEGNLPKSVAQLDGPAAESSAVSCQSSGSIPDETPAERELRLRLLSILTPKQRSLLKETGLSVPVHFFMPDALLRLLRMDVSAELEEIQE